MELGRTASCANILQVSVYSKPPIRRYAVFAFLAVMYAVILPWVWNTMGAPLERAKEEARNMDLKYALEAIDEFDEVTIDLDDEEVTSNNQTTTDNSTRTEYERPLPSPYLSDAGAMFSLFLLVFFHTLFFLLCHWLVWFNIKAFYAPADRVIAGRYLHVVPFPHRGKPAVCLIRRSMQTGNLEFSFQKQKFELNLPSERANKVIKQKLQLMDGSKIQSLPKEVAEQKVKEAKKVAEETGFILPLSPDIKQPLKFYRNSKGFLNEEEVVQASVRYGTNDLRADPVTLMNILVEQLLSPLSIFQFFSASLWFMDSYWQQAIFSFFMIILMEFTTAFQRHRITQMLRNLAPKPFPVFVIRGNKWMILPSDKLLPGDLVSLGKTPSGTKEGATVPCDCLILSGSAVVNEATLTGESVPQMKDAITSSESNEVLDVSGKHRLHVLFSGTSLISVTPSSRSKTPNNGCLCYVLRTGFSSSQGELMQMIEFSTERVSDSKETGYALLVLLGFALISSAYVFKVGLEKGERTTHELLLKCVIIITQVVPQHLPVQMAAAINYALIALNKKGILCTEPFRLPSAGKVTHCFFDKTGTLTSDELVPVGIINKKRIEDPIKSLDMIEPVHKACTETAMVLAACHSLIAMPDENGKKGNSNLLGDPIEVAAVKGVQWTYYPDKEVAKPGIDPKMVEELRKSIGTSSQETPDNRGQIEDMIKLAKRIEENSKISEIKILARHHFSSQLQRMSVIAKAKFKNQGDKLACLVKGSPEAIRKLLKPDLIPERYEEVYQSMAQKGMRVLALGYKYVSTTSPKFSALNIHKLSRDEVEENLEFAGFVSFECKIRGDTKAAIQALNHSAHRVVMVTGDALLTALHVARECSICLKKEALLLEENNGSLVWKVATSDKTVTTSFPFLDDIEGCGLRSLSESYDIVVTEKMLQEAVLVSNLKIWSEIDAVAVFARMSPGGKAEVIRYIQDKSNKKNLVFMCGDGGNDVGALKQADVGLALLSGFGSSNTDGITRGDDEETLNDLDKLEAIKKRKALKAKKKEAAARKKEIMKKQPDMVKAELARRIANGEEQSISLHFSVVKSVTMQLQNELKEDMQRLNAKYNIHNESKKSSSEDMSIFDKFKVAMEEQKQGNDPAESLGVEDGQVPIVRPGDASVAAPFTSRVPSIRSVVHLIRQGRCTLLSALQQQQTMMLECIISAYTLAALSLQGAQHSERQLIASSWLIITAIGAFSYSTPLESMHPVKPLKSLFHPAIISSIFLQAVIHLWCISYGVRIAKEEMGEEALQEVIAFNRAAARGLAAKLDEMDEESFNPYEQFMASWQHPFMPNLLNTVAFLLQTGQTMALYFVNYKGRPWMNGLLENHALFLSLFIAIGSVAVLAWELIPFVNDLLQLEPFPNDAFRVQVVLLVVLSIFGTFIADRVVTLVFAPKVFAAMWQSAKETTFNDVAPILSSLVKFMVGVIVFSAGASNPLIWLGAYWLYRQRNKYLEKLEDDELEKLEARLIKEA